MSLITKILSPFLEVKKWLFGKKDHGDPSQWVWQNDAFYTEEQRRNERLASLARYIEGASSVVDKRKKDKKRHSDVLEAIKLAQTERLMIETGRMVYDPAFGAWVVKGEK